MDGDRDEMAEFQKKYGIGIVGCGSISATHAEAIRHTEYGRVVTAHSRSQSSLDNFCRRFDLPGYKDYEKFLTHPDLDVVVICTPSGTHLDFGRAAAEAGKHVVVEKPIEVTLQRGKSLIESCRRHGVKLAVIYQNRFIEDVIRMKRFVEEGRIGKPFMVDVAVKWFRDQNYYDSAAWRGTLSLDGGGVVINQAIHTIDLMLWICGNLKSLYAGKGTFTHSGIEGEDNAVAVMEFEKGALGVFRASTSIVPPAKRRIEIHGPEGTALLDGDEFRLLKSEEEDSRQSGNNGGTGSGTSGPLAGMSYHHHKKQYDQILDALIHGSTPEVSGVESLKSLEVVQAIYTSSDRGEPVFFRESLSGSEAGRKS